MRYANSTAVPVQDMDIGAGEAGPVQLPPGEQVVTRHVVLPQNVLQMLQEHTAFLHQQGDVLPSDKIRVRGVALKP